MPQRVFLENKNRSITISGPLSGGPIPIDLGVTTSATLAGYKDIQILKLDGAYTGGDMAELKTHFSLGDAKRTDSSTAGTPIERYEINNNGCFVEVTPVP